MIHVFNGCSEVCSLPAKACKACERCCESCGCCEECEKCLTQCGSCVEQPLGSYVVVGMLVSLTELVVCILAFQEDFSQCQLPEGFAQKVGMRGWLKGQMGFAWLHFIFPPYLQHELLRKLGQRAGARAEISQKEVKESFHEVFLEDIGVCFYVFAWVASFAWSMVGVYWLHHTNCDPGGWTTAAAFVGFSFFWGLIFYSVVWYGYISCVSTMPVQWAIRLQEATRHGFSSGPSKGSRPQVSAATAAPEPLRAPPPAGCRKACTFWQLLKLVACLGLDLFGDATYFFPGIGEAADVAYAPVQGIALMMLFRSMGISAIGFTEELLPFTDFIPTATLAWILDSFFPDSCVGRACGFNRDAHGPHAISSSSSDSDA